MRIITYNVNGIRAAMNKDLVGWLKAAKPDVLCLQETKATPDQLDVQAFEALGYHLYWYSAQKKGYSSFQLLHEVLFSFQQEFLRGTYHKPLHTVAVNDGWKAEDLPYKQ